jgi:two-component system, sensor histidine kinase
MSAVFGSLSTSMSRSLWVNLWRTWFARLVLLTTLVLLLFLMCAAGSVLYQVRAQAVAKLENDSVVNLAAQMEREFLRLQHVFDISRVAPHIDKHEELALRLEIFASRVELLRDGPSVSVMQSLAEYQQLLPRLDEFVFWLDSGLAQGLTVEILSESALSKMHDLLPSVQQLSFAFNSQVLRQSERQQEKILWLTQRVMYFTAALCLGLVFSAYAILAWKREQIKTQDNLIRLNEGLTKANALAAEAGLAKTRFVANMSHEMRTPFHGILGALEIIKKDNLSEESRRLMGIAVKSANRLLYMINSLLELSSLDAGKISLKYEKTNLKNLINHVVQEFQHDAVSKGLWIRVEPGFDDLEIFIDKTRVSHIVSALVDNSIRYSNTGEILVQLDRVPNDSMGQAWLVKVRDQGPGISQDLLPRLFTRFTQADESRSRLHEGLGLSLTIAKSVARFMGGDLNYKKQVVGACFELLVISRPDLCTADASVLTNHNQKRLKVLVVEDHVANARLLMHHLKTMGHESVWAKDGEDALLKFDYQYFDVVLMDIHMPKMDGLTATKHMRLNANKFKSDTPIFAITADVLGELSCDYKKFGFCGLLAKPYRPDELLQLLSLVGPRHTGALEKNYAIDIPFS